MIGNPLGLLALLAIPVIIGIHLFRQRFKPRPVAGLFLWISPGDDPSAGRRLHKLERNLSLLLEILLALLLAFYLLNLNFFDKARLPHLVFVVDGSRSLEAEAGGESTRDRIRAEIDARLEEVGTRAQVSLIASGDRPLMLAGPRAAVAEAKAALKNFVAVERSHSLAPAIELARELAGPQALIRVYSDRLPRQDEEPDPETLWRALGQAHANTAILAARRERIDDERDRIFLRVAGFSGRETGAIPCQLQARCGDNILHSESFQIEARSDRRLAFDVDVGDRDVEVQLAPDALESDNHVLLVRPPKRLVSVRVAFPDDDPRTGVVLRALASGLRSRLTQDEGADVLISAASSDASAPKGTWHLEIGPPSDADSASPGRDLLGPFLSERGHPLLDGVELSRVIWRGARLGNEGLRPLVSAGAYCLIGVGRGGNEGRFLLNVDLGKGTFVRSPDWPIFIDNLLSMRQSLIPGAARANLRAGETLDVVLPRDRREGWQLIDPHNESRDLAALESVKIEGLETPGAWRIEREGEILHRFGVQAMDALESDLSPAVTKTKDAKAGTTSAEEEAEGLVDPRLHFPLLLLGFLAFFANWFVLSRQTRRTLG